MKIDLDEARQADFKVQLQHHFRTEFDESLSDFRADQLLALAVAALGPAIYNQAVQDVRAHFQTKLDDLEGEVYLP